MKNTIEVRDYNSWAVLQTDEPTPLKCRVIAVEIRNRHVIYEVAYWANGERMTMWVHACELDEIDDDGEQAPRQTVEFQR